MVAVGDLPSWATAVVGALNARTATAGHAHRRMCLIDNRFIVIRSVYLIACPLQHQNLTPSSRLVSPQLLALIPLAVGINLALGQFAAVTQLPLFLDTVGTVLIAVLVGPWIALATGFVSQLVFTVVSGSFPLLWFLPVHLAVAWYAGVGARWGVFRGPGRALLAGAGLGILAAVLSWPISFYVFGGVTGGGVTVVTAMLRGLGFSLGQAVLLGGLSNDVPDKAITFLLVRTILASLPIRMRNRFPDADRALGQSR